MRKQRTRDAMADRRATHGMTQGETDKTLCGRSIARIRAPAFDVPYPQYDHLITCKSCRRAIARHHNRPPDNRENQPD